jgi:hypothetical protein
LFLFFFSFSAFKYEIRCYTNRDALTEATFTEKGILVHDSFTPDPLFYGSRQTCTVGVPWPNEVFYYGLVAVDEAGNRSPISNILSVYIYEAPTTTTTTTSTTTTLIRTLTGAAIPLLASAEDVLVSNGGHERAWSKHVRVYIATGVICGLLLIIIAVIIFILVRVKTKRTTYDTEAKDTYKAYEPTNPGGGQHPKSGDKLTSWLDSLPRSEVHNTLRSSGHSNGQHSPNTTASHELSLNESTNGTLRRNGGGTNSNTHTLTKTNPYRHKVLTNGSFLNLTLKDVVGPLASSGSDDASNSSRPTTSTENDTNSDSGNSHENNNNKNKVVVISSSLRRSNTNTANHTTTNHHNTQHQQRAYQPADLLPPPDGFDSSAQYPIDTNTAKAIIDTYSGHLFSRSTNYQSFNSKNNNRNGSNGRPKYPKSPVETLFTRDPTNMENDSLDQQNGGSSGSNYYDRQQQQQQHSRMGPGVPPKPNTRGPVKTRTESVV